MREIVTIQCGQCGNAVGNAMWENLLKEHRLSPSRPSSSGLGVGDDTLSAFFRVDDQEKLKARAVLVDMECGPLQETMKSSLGPLFDETQFVMDVSGAGN